jgi:solute carrier family 35 protein E1
MARKLESNGDVTLDTNNNTNPQQHQYKSFKDSQYFKSPGNAPFGRNTFSKEKRQSVSETTRVVFLCVIWYILSSTGNVLNKFILTNYLPGYAITMSFGHLTIIVLLLPALHKLWRIPVAQSLSRRYTYRFIIPLAIGKFMASISSQFSIYKIPVSYSHTIKASMPIFTVFFTSVLMREKYSFRVWCSLLPIVCGVAIATVTELQFNWMGMTSSLFATALFSLQNIYSKKVLKETRMHHLRLLYLISRSAFAMLLPVWLIFDVRGMASDEALVKTHANPLLTFILLLLSACIMFGQNIVAFTVISLLTPLSYAVANAAKRIFVIIFSLVTLKNPVTYVNLFGMGVSCCGVWVYNKAKLTELAWKNKKLKYTLPTTSRDVRDGISMGSKNSSDEGYINPAYQESKMYKQATDI